jgi:hypothetical protein
LFNFLSFVLFYLLTKSLWRQMTPQKNFFVLIWLLKCLPARLIEKRRNSRCRRSRERGEGRGSGRRLNREVKFGSRVALDVAQLSVCQIFEGGSWNSRHFVQKRFHVCKVETENIRKSRKKQNTISIRLLGLIAKY